MGFAKFRPAVQFVHDLRTWSDQARQGKPWVRRSGSKVPGISVIVPCYNAERWIAALIHSIQSQNIDDIEILIVDDKSTDNSVKVIKALQTLDRRIHLIDGEGRGPGAARNKAVRKARGAYITFADADDLVLPKAYERMRASLKATGSDFVTGGYVRHKNHQVSRPRIVSRVHHQHLESTTVEQFPEVFEEPVLWNKMFVKDFWTSQVGDMPEDVNYEDQLPILKAALFARAFDVLPDDVYSWRISADGTSRSGTKKTFQDASDRVTIVHDMWMEANRHNAPAALRKHMLHVWIERDLPMYAVHLSSKSEEDPYVSTISGLAQDLMRWADEFPDIWEEIPFTPRMICAVVASGNFADILEVLGRRLELRNQFRADAHRQEFVVEVLALQQQLPDFVRQVQPSDFTLTSEVQSVEWNDHSNADLTVTCYSLAVDPVDLDNVTFKLVTDDGQVRGLEAQRTESPELPATIRSPWFDYGHCAFTLNVSDMDFERAHIVASASWASFSAETKVKPCGSPAGNTPSPLKVDQRFVLSSEKDIDGNSLVIERMSYQNPPVVIEAASGRSVSLRASNDASLTVSLTSGNSGIRKPVSSGSVVRFALPPVGYRLLAGWSRKWSVAVDSNPVPIKSSPAASTSACSAVEATVGSSGELVLDQKAVRVVVDSVESQGSSLIVKGCMSSPRVKPQLWISSNSQAIKAKMQWSGQQYKATFPATSFSGKSYFLRWSMVSKNRLTRSAVAPGLLQETSVVSGSVHTFRVQPRPNGTTAIFVSEPQRIAAQTRWGTTHIHDSSKLIDGIYFETFEGKSTRDNPGAICRYLLEQGVDVPIWMGVRHEGIEVPEGVIPVLVGSDEWFEVISTARVIVGNNNFPSWYEKREGQYWIQTWHGSPIKRLAWDAKPNFIGLEYRRLMVKQAKQWDVLLAQSELAGNRLAGSVNYEGEILVGEYPRNIAIVEGLQRAQEIKNQLGIASDKKVILWAPTWRYNNKTIEFPAKELVASGDYVVMTRGHHMQSLGAKGKHVVNVSDYPVVEHLMAIADVLISDYSSIFFDFELLNRHALVYTPDLEDYRETERGFYGSWPEDSNLPFAGTSKELVDLLGALDFDTASTTNADAIHEAVDYTMRAVAKKICSALSSE